ncbi:MAG: hypothetical protein ABI297_01845 [Ginsengibacter sp.]
MSTKSHVRGRVTAALSIAFLIPPLILFMMWVSIGMRRSSIDANDKIDIYLGYFGGLFNDLHVINIVSIVFCLVSIVLASKSFKKHLLSIRVLMLLTVLVAIFIILFDLFQLV